MNWNWEKVWNFHVWIRHISWSICIPPTRFKVEWIWPVSSWVEKINVYACSITVSDDEADSSEFRFTWFFKSFLSFFSQLLLGVWVVASRCKWQIAYHIFVYLSSHVWTPLCHEMNIKAAHLNVWLIGAPLTLNRKHLNRLVLSRCHDTLTFDKNGVQPRWASPQELNRDKKPCPKKKNDSSSMKYQ